VAVDLLGSRKWCTRKRARAKWRLELFPPVDDGNVGFSNRLLTLHDSVRTLHLTWRIGGGEHDSS